ncbi:hypothetical protein LI177_00605 [bacterium 210820-DFI.6.37]|nr:hypothetical protein [bacterium 210820-DFI.6.37]
MADADRYYPNLTWSQFAMCNDDATGAFEDMSRRLFALEFLENGTVPHSDHNNPGVEVLPNSGATTFRWIRTKKNKFSSKAF